MNSESLDLSKSISIPFVESSLLISSPSPISEDIKNLLSTLLKKRLEKKLTKLENKFDEETAILKHTSKKFTSYISILDSMTKGVEEIKKEKEKEKEKLLKKKEEEKKEKFETKSLKSKSVAPHKKLKIVIKGEYSTHVKDKDNVDKNKNKMNNITRHNYQTEINTKEHIRSKTSKSQRIYNNMDKNKVRQIKVDKISNVSTPLRPEDDKAKTMSNFSSDKKKETKKINNNVISIKSKSIKKRIKPNTLELNKAFSDMGKLVKKIDKFTSAKSDKKAMTIIQDKNNKKPDSKRSNGKKHVSNINKKIDKVKKVQPKKEKKGEDKKVEEKKEENKIEMNKEDDKKEEVKQNEVTKEEEKVKDKKEEEKVVGKKEEEKIEENKKGEEKVVDKKENEKEAEKNEENKQNNNEEKLEEKKEKEEKIEEKKELKEVNEPKEVLDIKRENIEKTEEKNEIKIETENKKEDNPKEVEEKDKENLIKDESIKKEEELKNKNEIKENIPTTNQLSSAETIPKEKQEEPKIEKEKEIEPIKQEGANAEKNENQNLNIQPEIAKIEEPKSVSETKPSELPIEQPELNKVKPETEIKKEDIQKNEENKDNTTNIENNNNLEQQKPEEKIEEKNNNDNQIQKAENENIENLIENFRKDNEDIKKENDEEFIKHYQSQFIDIKLNQSMNQSMSFSQSFLESRSFLGEKPKEKVARDPNIPLTLDEMIKKYKNDFIYVFDFLEFNERVQFTGIHRGFKSERIYLLNTKREEAIASLELKDKETIEDRLNQFQLRCSKSEYTKPLGKFIISKSTLTATQSVDKPMFSKLFQQKTLDLKLNDIYVIFRLLFILMGEMKIAEIIDDGQFWEKCIEYLNKNGKDKIGSFILEKSKTFNFNHKNIYLMNLLLVGIKPKMIPVTFSKISGTTGLLFFIIKEALEFAGVLITSKTPKNRIYDNLIYYKNIINSLTNFIDFLSNIKVAKK